jgi:hypothetical protein
MWRNTAALCAIILMSVSGCDKGKPATQAELVGKWTGNISTMDLELVLHPDGTFDKDDSGDFNPFYKSSGMADVTTWGRWRVTADGELVFGDPKGITTSSVFATIKGKDELEIRSGAEATAYKLTKATGPLPPPGSRYIPGEGGGE